MSSYATHLPVLAEVMDRECPARVLEYGAGDISTRFFLAFPVEHLTSVEVDKDWRGRITTNDPRHTVLAEGQPDASDFGLIFIDDGQNAAERTETIRAVLLRPHPAVVIHDAEVYADVIDDLATDYRIFPTAPDTAVIEATNR